MNKSRSRPAGWQMRVLVVEDDHSAAQCLAQLLDAAGHLVEVAHDGFAALRAALRNPPDVVLLDLHLPGLCGWDVAAKLQDLPGPKKPLLVAVTGYGAEDDLCRSEEVGIDLHLTKPVDVDQLQQVLERFRSLLSPPEDRPSQVRFRLLGSEAS